MSLSPGDRLGPYEFVSRLGVGGMGEVWKARDPRLGREVAIKVSAQQFSDRFEREARAIAALNHPHICTLYDVGPNYLVMELVEGPTLAERIAEGAIPLDEALGIAKQIGEALEAAHEKAIVHRDLKPANIKIRPDGSVKVLDFGLAKAGADPEVTSESPTMMPGGTRTGMIMGSAGYMSPEQARGQVATKRADIWAFGVVLYEMVTAKRLFDGETVSDSLVAILKDEPDLSLAPEKTRRLLRACLEKDPKKRLRDISGAEFLLEAEPLSAAPSRSRFGTAVGWVVLGALLMALATLYFRTPNVSAPETRVDIVTPATSAPSSFALSPDGRRIAFVASGDGASRLWVRSLDSTSAQALPGTEGALHPFWSPDSRSLGFFANSKLKRIDLGGGQPQALADVAALSTQGAWSEEGVILFSQGAATPLSRVPASGGQAAAATKLGNGQAGHCVPRFLPGGRQFLFMSFGGAQALWLGSLDGGEPRRIATLTPGTDSAAEYLAPGWLVRVRQAVLTAQRFDAGRGQLSGDPVTLAQAVGVDPNTWAGSFSVSPTGAIAWRSGGGADRRQLIWFNRAGQNVGTLGGPDEFNTRFPELSPEGKRTAVTRGPVGLNDIWIEEGTRASRFTFGQGATVYAIWSPDGARVVYGSNRKGALDLYQKPANGSGGEEILLQSADNKRPNSWSPDGRFILYHSSLNNGDLMVLPLTGDRKPFPLLSTPFNEQQGAFSPDGKWVA
ncbi:MAG: LpqB family beta-propeller domain-containing protein, partial [Bryobacteraceae bacterium]